MSDKKKEPSPKEIVEAVYSAEELMKAARTKFGVTPELAGAALKFYGIAKATVDEAMKLIEKFKKREVK